MKTFEWNVRTIVTILVAFLLTVSVGVMGIWVLLSGQPGTGMMEQRNHTAMMKHGEHSATAEVVMPDHLMGAPADRGTFGGFTGMIGLIMILNFVAIVALLLYALLRGRPEQPQPSYCWNCGRPVETDWTSCPYCGVELADAGRQPKPVGA